MNPARWALAAAAGAALAALAVAGRVADVVEQAVNSI